MLLFALLDLMWCLGQDDCFVKGHTLPAGKYTGMYRPTLTVNKGGHGPIEPHSESSYKR